MHHRLRSGWLRIRPRPQPEPDARTGVDRRDVPRVAPTAGVARVSERKVIKGLMQELDVTCRFDIFHTLLPPSLIPRQVIQAVPGVDTPTIRARRWRGEQIG